MLRRKKKKEPKYTIKLTPEVWEKLPQLTKKQIAELLARLKQAEEEAEEWKKKYEELKGKLEPKEVKVLKEALKEKKKIEKRKELRRLALVPFAVVNGELKEIHPTFVPYGGGVIVGKNGKYKYFAGWEIQETEDGIYKSVNFLLKTDKKSKKVARISPSPSAPLSILEFPYLVQKILTGVYDAPIKKDGTLIEIPVTEESEIAYIQEIERLRQKIAKLEEEKEQVEAKMYEVSKKYQELMVENQKLKTELTLASYRADMATALSQDQAEKIKGMMRDYATLLNATMTAQVNEMLQRRMAWVLAEGNKILREELERAYGTSISDEVWNKIEARFNKMLERIMTSLPKMPIVPSPAPKPPKKEEGKK